MPVPLSDEQLIRDFESDALPADSFHHADHIRLAFAYLRQYPVLRALEKFIAALQRFAVARGKPQLYHETITYAYVFLIRERMARCEGAGWEEFALRNPDLLAGKNDILMRYYHDATLRTDFARTVFMLPDKFQ
ncbi:MAG: hypothetical protein WAL56_17870 [Candidatus Sulfotelmatobacter sp.]